MEQRDFGRLVGTNLDRVLRRFRVACSVRGFDLQPVVPRKGAIRPQRQIPGRREIGSLIDPHRRDLLALLVPGKRIFRIEQQDQRRFHRHVGGRLEGHLGAFPAINRSAGRRLGRNLHVVRMDEPDFIDPGRRRLHDAHGIVDRPRVARLNPVRQVLQQAFPVGAGDQPAKARQPFVNSPHLQRLVDKRAIGRRVEQLHRSDELAANIGFDRQLRPGRKRHVAGAEVTDRRSGRDRDLARGQQCTADRGERVFGRKHHIQAGNRHHRQQRIRQP